MSAFSDEQRVLLSQYVTNPDGRVFCVNLPGLVGALFARYSRAKTGLRETLVSEFIDEKGCVKYARADDILERILIAFGDDSVGELEGAHMSLEQISNLATKVVEDVRIGGSPIEQSTRYVLYDQKDVAGKFKYFREPKIMAHPELGRLYEYTMDCVFQTYCDLVNPMIDFLSKLKPIDEYEVELKEKGVKVTLADLKEERDIKDFRRTYREMVRTKACDTIRVVLPAATLTNVGVFGNGRYFLTLLNRLYSHPLAEMGVLAQEAKSELDKVIPKFVKRAKADEYVIKTEKDMQNVADGLFKSISPRESSSVQLVGNEFSEENILAGMLYKFCEHPLEQVRDVVKNLSMEKRAEIRAVYVGERQSRRDRCGRALEFGYPLTFDLLGDFGIYRDLERHRMLTQERQRLSTRNGFWMPDVIVEAGLDDKVAECRDKSAVLYEHIREDMGRDEAQYGVLFGFNIRWHMGMNPRAAQHMWELRTGPQGHPNYRKMCQEMCRTTKEKFPFLADAFGFVNDQDIFWSRAESEAAQRRKERALEGNV